MKMVKIPVVTSDAIVADNFIYVDISTLNDVTVGATTTVFAGTGWTVTFTFDGSDAAAKLLNANNAAAYLLPIFLEFCGDGVNRNQSQKVFNLFSGLDIAGILSAMTITSPGTNDGLVSIALS